MTLEDFFTLTEMKDGLTAPSRVQELVSVMQKEQDCGVKNAGDATRQWASVASTIAATENKDCLDLFIQLDGLWFINRWLKDAQNFVADANDGFIEESITAMLRAVEKLHLHSKNSISTELWITVSKLLGHHSTRIQDRARRLFFNWEGGENRDAKPHDMDIDRVNNSSDEIVREEGRPSAMNGVGNNDGHASGIVGENSKLGSSDSLLPEVASEQIQSSDNARQSSVSKDCEDTKETSNQLSSVLNSVKEIAPTSEAVAMSAETCNSPVPKPGSFDGEPDDLHLNDSSKEEKQNQNGNGSPGNLATPDISLSSAMPEPGSVSTGANETKTLESVEDPVSEHNAESNENGVCHDITVSCGMRAPAFDRKDDGKAVNSSNPQPSKASESSQNGEGSNQSNDASTDSDSFKMGKVPRSPNTIDKSSKIELDYGIVDAFEVARQVAQEVDHVSNQGNDASNRSDSFKRRRRPRSPNVIHKSSDMELEYGIVDALEVARQVAQEVERDLRSSSSEKISEDGNRQPGSPESTGKKGELTHILPEEVSSRRSNSADACSEEEGHLSYSDNTEAEPECVPDLESSQVTETARDPGGNSEKSLCTFDLNEEVGSDDMDVSVNAISTTPIPVVSASKPAHVSWSRTSPLQFEGTLGWKGSAATSAFRPASPRKNFDAEKNVSFGGNSDTTRLRQKQNFLDIDLNVAEGDEELVKRIGESSGLPSGQSSSRLELDLNSIGDDGNAQPSDHRMEGLLFSGRNGYWSPSPASSLSSMQPSARNIDLNDRPFFQTDLVGQGPVKFSHMDSYRHSKSDAPVISILGAKVEVGRREYVPQTLPLPNGKAIEPVIDLTMSGAGGILGMVPSVPYNNSAVFGYNGLTSAPPLSFSPAMYGSGGSIPYMVDSRGAPVVPQVGGGSYSQPPFIMSMAASTQLGLNSVGPLRPNFDLNSGFILDGGHRDTLAARQFFFPSPARATEEHVRSSMPQPSSSGVGGKRKEPESGWEPYPYSYKNPQPPWK